MTKVEWDGRPLQAFTRAEVMHLYSFVPQWHGVAVGPMIPFAQSRASVEVNAIFTTDRTEAEETMWLHAEAACAREGLEYDAEQWEITKLVLVNGS